MGVISTFLHERKEKWLANEIKPTKMSDPEIEDLKNAAEDKFAIEQWIPDTAKKARQLSVASHVCKFSHPDAKASPFIAKGVFRKDGYLRSGNVKHEHVDCDLDAFGNAAAIGAYKCVSLKMSDGKTVLEHLEQDSDEIRSELSLFKEKYDEIREDFLAIKQGSGQMESDERLKQVYFPVDDQYHLLSLLTSSLIVTELRGRARAMRDRFWRVRDKKSEEYGQNYEVIYDLSVIGIGGANSQNVSVLNAVNNGEAYLLSSSPPNLSQRNVVRPRRDFFVNTLRYTWFSEEYRYLHSLLASEQNNLAVRERIKKTINAIVDHVMVNVFRLRDEEPGWSEQYTELPLAQKIWLDDSFTEAREQQQEWLKEVSLSFARWVIIAYEYALKNDHIPLGAAELTFLQEQVTKALQQDKESLR